MTHRENKSISRKVSVAPMMDWTDEVDFSIRASDYRFTRRRVSKLFKNGDSQAVRLPKEFRFAGDEVLIKRVGSAVVLLPKAKSWDTLVESLDKFPADFMSDRQQPGKAERRDSLP